MLFQNIDHITFVPGHVFLVISLVLIDNDRTELSFIITLPHQAHNPPFQNLEAYVALVASQALDRKKISIQAWKDYVPSCVLSNFNG